MRIGQARHCCTHASVDSGLKSGDSVMAETEQLTPLHRAAESGGEDNVREVLKRGNCNVNCTDSKGWTPLHWACARGHLGVVRVLVTECGADTNVCDQDNNMPIHVAACKSEGELVLCLLNECGCDPNLKGQYGRSILHSACKGGNVDLVRTLIKDYKTDIYSQDNNRAMPIHLAIYFMVTHKLHCV